MIKIQTRIALPVIAFLLASCSSPPERSDSARAVPDSSLRDPKPAERQTIPQQNTEAEPIESVRNWVPRFVQTGLASGIMVEFTGVKKDKPLHARYAGIELRRAQAGSMPTFSPSLEARETLTEESRKYEPFTLVSSINDEKQAFFRVPPGTYHLRQTRVWADQTPVRDVEVREGNYSVISIQVKIPPPSQQ